jgi:hypothetical protein
MSFAGGVNLLNFLYQTMDTLTTTRIGVFVGDAYYLFYWLAVAWLIWAGVKIMGTSVTASHDGHGLVDVLAPIARVVGVFCLLHYYNLNTLPGTSLYISTMFPAMGAHMAHQIDLSVVDTVNAKIAQIGAGSLVFALAGPLASAGYFAFKLIFIVVEGALLVVNVTPFLFQGAGVLFGPYFMVAPLVPFGVAGFLLRNWLLFMAGMALYRAVGAALVYTWCTALSMFIDQAIHGDFSITHFLELSVILGAFTIGLVFSLIGIPFVVGALLHGGGAAARGVGAAVLGAATMIRNAGAKQMVAVNQGVRIAQGATQPVAATVKVKP